MRKQISYTVSSFPAYTCRLASYGLGLTNDSEGEVMKHCVVSRANDTLSTTQLYAH